MDRLALLDELQAIARTGLAYAENPYDRERYERLLDLATRGYAEALDLPEADVRARLAQDLGYVTAKVGADAAIVDGDRILLIRRADDGCWGLVSGWVDPGETPATTVVREVAEEIGLTATIDRLVGVFGRPAAVDAMPHATVSVVYLCTVAPGGMTLAAHEVTDARWWRPDDVDAWHQHHETLARAAIDAARGAPPVSP